MCWRTQGRVRFGDLCRKEKPGSELRDASCESRISSRDLGSKVEGVPEDAAGNFFTTKVKKDRTDTKKGSRANRLRRCWTFQGPQVSVMETLAKKAERPLERRASGLSLHCQR